MRSRSIDTKYYTASVKFLFIEAPQSMSLLEGRLEEVSKKEAVVYYLSSPSVSLAVTKHRRNLIAPT